MQKGDDGRGGQNIWTVGNFSYNSGQLGGTTASNTFRETWVAMEMEKMGEKRTTYRSVGCWCPPHDLFSQY